MSDQPTLLDYGLTPVWSARFDQIEKEERAVLGRVVRQDRGFVMVRTEQEVILAAVRPKSAPVLVGDWVVVQDESVQTMLERESLLVRKDAHLDREQPLVANVDVVFIVCGVDRPVNIRRIERAVTQTKQSGARPIVVLSKSDLAENIEEIIEDMRASPLDVDVIAVASKLDRGLDAIRASMQRCTSVLIGESGAGKSTLVNALLGDEITETGSVRGGDAKGRHTTTRRELHLTPSGVLIDTPGIRALGLWADEASIAATFPEVAEAAELCRFNNCAHQGEPGCAVALGIETGELHPERVAAWLAQVQEMQDLAQVQTEHERRKRDRKFARTVDDALKRKGRR